MRSELANLRGSFFIKPRCRQLVLALLYTPGHGIKQKVQTSLSLELAKVHENSFSFILKSNDTAFTHALEDDF